MKKILFLLALNLFLLSVGSGDVSAEDGSVNNTSINLNTYGVLPCTIINMTPYNIYTTFSGTNLDPQLPAVVGNCGVLFPDSTSQSNTSELPIYGNSQISNGAYPTVLAAVEPLPSSPNQNTPVTFTASPYVMNCFTLFPSGNYNSTAQIPNSEFLILPNNTYTFNSAVIYGTNANAMPTIDGFPTNREACGSGDTVGASLYSMGNPSTFNLNLYFDLASGGDTAASPVSFQSHQPPAAGSADYCSYQLQINSQGLQSTYQEPAVPSGNLKGLLGLVYNSIVMLDSFTSLDPLAISAAVYGEYSSIKNISSDSKMSNTNTAYAVQYAGLTAGASNNSVLMQKGITGQGGLYVTTDPNGQTADDSTLTYEQMLQLADQPNQNYFLRNQLIIYTVRQACGIDTNSALTGTADHLRIVVLNYCVNAAVNLISLSCDDQITPEAKSEFKKVYRALGYAVLENPAAAKELISGMQINDRLKYANMSSSDKAAKKKQWLMSARELLMPLTKKYAEIKQLKLMTMNLD